MIEFDLIRGTYTVTDDEALAFADWFDDICGGLTDIGDHIRTFVTEHVSALECAT